jgi:hypothetical protein
LFTVLERERESEQRLGIYLGSDHTTSNACHIERSDDISADYILGVVKDKIAPGSLVVVDYLQLMDEKRVNPPIQEQIEQLKSFAREHRCIFIFLGQVSPEVDGRQDQVPSLEDVRLPNPLDLAVFNKIIFLSQATKNTDQIAVNFCGKVSHCFMVGLDPVKRCVVDLD